MSLRPGIVVTGPDSDRSLVDEGEGLFSLLVLVHCLLVVFIRHGSHVSLRRKIVRPGPGRGRHVLAGHSAFLLLFACEPLPEEVLSRWTSLEPALIRRLLSLMGRGCLTVDGSFLLSWLVAWC